MARRKQTKTKTKRGMRPVWKGNLKISLVSIPVRAFTAKVPGGGEIDLDWLHEDCHSRIRYQKVCPIHGEVQNEEIVSGYKYGRNKYVIIEPAELDRMRSKSADSISLDTFIPADILDTRYYTDRTYYLVPDGAEAARAYAVFQQAMNEHEVVGMAQLVLFRRDQLVVVRPVDDLLVMTALNYANEFKDPRVFSDEVPAVKTTSKELALASSLIEASTVEHFNYAQYKDPYVEKLKEYVAAKVKGQEIETPPEADEEPEAVNFLDALKESISRARQHHGNGRQGKRKVS